jgi:hypothetical protein
MAGIAGIAATADRLPAVRTVAAAIRRRHRIARAPTEAIMAAPDRMGAPVTTAAPDRTAARAEARAPMEAIPDAEPNLISAERRLQSGRRFFLP